MLINIEFVRLKNIWTHWLPRVIPVYNIDGTPNEAGHITEVVNLIVQYKDHSKWVTSHVISISQTMVYCNPLALGRDLAHIIITCSLSDIYIHGPLCVLLATLCLSSPHDTCGPSSLPHTDSLSGQSPCQDYCRAAHFVRTPCTWHIVRVRCPNQEVGTTWGSLSRTPHGTMQEWHMVRSS